MRITRREILAVTATATGALVVGSHPATAADRTDPVPVALDGLFDNNGIGTAAGDADLDGSGYGFPAGTLASGDVTLGGVPYRLATTTAAGQADNVVALGQTVALPPGRYAAAHLLATGTYGSAGGTAAVHYADGGATGAELSAPDWYSGGSGATGAPYRYSPTGTD